MNICHYKCRKCGHITKYINMIKTGGYVECEECKYTARFIFYERAGWIPVYDMDDIPPEILKGTKSVAEAYK